jgi:tryptophan-rich sensory protein
MGITLYLILKQRQHPLFKASLALFFVQLTLNFFWSFIFFKFQLLGIALIEIIFLWLIIIAMITTTYKLNKTAALIQIPYLLWVSFASLLNAAIWYLN